MSPSVLTADVAIIGGGAAGLATAIFTARAAPHLRVVVLDGARRLGAKILVSGGSRCNVTNRIVSERDYWGGSPRTIRNVLRAYSAARAAAFFEEIGVALHEEEDGKLFPDTNSARTVLDALLREVAAGGVEVRLNARVRAVTRAADGFVVIAGEERLDAGAVVLATGGRSLPKTGSDGFGYELAARLGHGCVTTTPALAPLVLEGDTHASLSGVAHRAAVTVGGEGGEAVRIEGSMLWTHFGISGPVALNASRHWHRARVEDGDARVLLAACPDDTFESIEAWWRERERARPRALVATTLATRLPAAVAAVVVARSGVPADRTLAHLSRDERRRLTRTLLETELAVRDSRGYNYAEVTAGGVPLDEIDSARMASRLCPGLYLVGEILDVDGRLGGFNFQWAWSSAWVAAQAIAHASPCPVPPR